ncbi:MAG: DHH family phosphoesterase [Clostridia bacterium]|nr:DHH family phosphoesterase [Clostridia bacterium]
MYETVIKKLHSAYSVAVFMHVNPDGDCVSSSLALYTYLTNAGKQVHCFLEENNKIRDNLAFLPHIDVINKDSFKAYDLGIAVDCAAASRMGPSSYKKFLKCDDQIGIDHHMGNTPFVETMILEPKAASTTQILYKLLKEYDPKYIDNDVATLLYAGLITDSGGLSFSSTTSETMHVAAELSDYGVDIYMLNRKLSKDTKLNVFQLTNRVLSKAAFYYDNRVGIISFLQEDFDATGTTTEETEGIINEIIDIIGVKIAIAVSAMDAHAYKVGIRTKDGVDASACAAYFGGGGHFNAGGCRIYADYETTISKLLKMAGEMLDA